MNLILNAVEIPLRMDEQNVLRVGQTRVLADLIIDAYNSGDLPEDIGEQYTAVSLAQVYAVIAYYLQHQTELDQYLEESRAKMDLVRAEIELRQRDSRIRKVVLEQLNQSGAEHS